MRTNERVLKNMRSTTSNAKPNPLNADRRQIEASKTSRLRALRLAAEAEDRAAAARAAAAAPPKAAKRRVRATTSAAKPETT
jgi:hypothetical protein